MASLLIGLASQEGDEATLTSATRGKTLSPNPNECNSTLTRVELVLGGILSRCKILENKNK